MAYLAWIWARTVPGATFCFLVQKCIFIPCLSQIDALLLFPPYIRGGMPLWYALVLWVQSLTLREVKEL